MSQPKPQESKEAFEREKQMHLEHEAKFIDDLKRAILLDGGYVDRLDQEVNIWAVFVLWREGAPESKSREGEAGRQGERCMLCSSEAFYVQFRQNLAQTVHSFSTTHCVRYGSLHTQYICRSQFNT